MRTGRDHKMQVPFDVIKRALALLVLSCLGAASAFSLQPLAAPAEEPEQRRYRLEYTFTLTPETESARVTVEIPDARLVRELDFNLDPARHSDVSANGTLVVEDGRAVWTPPETNARLTLTAAIVHERDPGEYDSLITEDWAIFRGDDLVPPARVRTLVGARSDAVLRFELPEDWPSVNAGWHTLGPREFQIDNPERRFDRPTGWMIAGKLGTRRDQIGATQIAVSGPKDSGLRRMDILTFLNVVWPEAEDAFQTMPSKLLLVGAGEPMWRGGLSASNSLFLHKDRPLVSENGTSPLVHELVHMVTGIQGAQSHDWIAEGLTEYYSVELLHRAGAMTEKRRDHTFEDLARWGADVETLLQPRSTGAVTARAAVLFDQLDQEIRERSELDIDALTRRLMAADYASLADVKAVCREIVGGACKTLETSLLSLGEETVERSTEPTQ